MPPPLPCRELSVCRTQLAAVAAERDGLREDLRGVRESKLVADRSWRSEREACAQLERELAFYQAQSASAMVPPPAPRQRQPAGDAGASDGRMCRLLQGIQSFIARVWG